MLSPTCPSHVGESICGIRGKEGGTISHRATTRTLDHRLLHVARLSVIRVEIRQAGMGPGARRQGLSHVP